MEQYLLQHNVTMTDFWILFSLFVLGIAFMTYLWVKTIKLYKEEKENNLNHNWMMWIVSSLLTIKFLPVFIMGIWHFFNMVTTLLWNFDLYWII